MTPVLRFVDTVVLTTTTEPQLTPAQARILAACDQAARVIGRDLTITCGREGHPASDPHTLGRAFDLRTKDLPDQATLALLQFLRAQLGSDFTVLYEVPAKITGLLAAFAYVDAGATAPHIHIQTRKGLAAWPA